MDFENSSPFLRAAGQNAVFYQDDLFLAIYNIAPLVPGHCLIVPRRYIKRIMDLSDDECRLLMPFARQVMSWVGAVFAAHDCNWIIQDGQAAGQTVDHLHLHIIPRYENDYPRPGDWYPQFLSHQEATIDSQHRLHLKNDQMLMIVQHLKKFIDQKTQSS